MRKLAPNQLSGVSTGSRCYTFDGHPSGREVGTDTVRWEYRIINIRSENYRIDPAKESELNARGDAGWELVAITAINDKTAATDHIGMVFKRPRGFRAGL